MTGSHARWPLAWLLFAVVIGHPAPSAGQQSEVGQPIPLTPQPLLQPPPSDGQEGAVEVPGPTPSPEVPQIQGIEVDRLEAMDRASLGALSPDQGGLGFAMWQGSARQPVARLLHRLPGERLSPELFRLARRLLLSSAAAPEDGGLAEQGDDQVSVIGGRIQGLRAIGDRVGLADLLRVVPQGDDDEAIARARVETWLLDGQLDEACRKVRSATNLYLEVDFWPKAMVFCQFLSGQTDQAQFGLGLLREQGGAKDPAFLVIADSYAGIEAGPVAAADVDVLHFVMMRERDLPLPADLAETAPPVLWTALAAAPNAPLEARAAAAERAVGAGLLDGAALAEIYRAFPFTPEELANAIAGAAKRGGPESRALLYQAAEYEGLPVIRAEVIRVALVAAESAGLQPPMTRALEPMLLDLPVVAELSWFAGTAGRALYALGRTAEAAAWLRLATRDAAISPEAAAAAAALWPYARLAGAGPLAALGGPEAWSSAADEAAADLPRRRVLLNAAFQALEVAGTWSWTQLAAAADPLPEQLPDAVMLFALLDAGDAGRVGEVVLFSVLLLGRSDPGERDPLAFGVTLQALKRVGLVEEARALATETLYASGV